MSYIDDIKKVKDSRHHSITNCYGLNDYYKYYKKNYNCKVNQRTYTAILKDIFWDLVNSNLINQLEVVFPCKIGILKPYIVKPVIKKTSTGKFVKGTPIDWDSTIKYWEKDAYAKENKILIHYEVNKLAGIRFVKRMKSYVNQKYFTIKVARNLRKYFYKKIVLNDNFNLNG